MQVLSFKPFNLFEARSLLKLTDADIYHSQEPSLGTYLASEVLPGRKHIVTFRDTRNVRDWRLEINFPSLNPTQTIVNWMYEDNYLVHRAVRRAEAWYAAANFLISKARLKYRLSADPVFLPTPVEMPGEVVKSRSPVVCFVSRWDRRKRPELFFNLARSFPNVRFVAVGKSRDQAWEKYLRMKYADIPNLELSGFIDQFRSKELNEVLSRSWIFVNTSLREGLPNSFVEAAANRCSILSAVNPDGFASEFGYHVRGDDFSSGLEYLLSNDRWRELGAKGFDYVNENFAVDRALESHLAAYNSLMDRGGST